MVTVTSWSLGHTAAFSTGLVTAGMVTEISELSLVMDCSNQTLVPHSIFTEFAGASNKKLTAPVETSFQ